jgi:hypothetical protein
MIRRDRTPLVIPNLQPPYSLSSKEQRRREEQAALQYRIAKDVGSYAMILLLNA